MQCLAINFTRNDYFLIILLLLVGLCCTVCNKNHFNWRKLSVCSWLCLTPTDSRVSADVKHYLCCGQHQKPHLWEKNLKCIHIRKKCWSLQSQINVVSLMVSPPAAIRVTAPALSTHHYCFPDRDLEPWLRREQRSFFPRTHSTQERRDQGH